MTYPACTLPQSRATGSTKSGVLTVGLGPPRRHRLFRHHRRPRLHAGDPTPEPFTFYAYFPDKVGRWANVFYQAEPAVPIIPGQWHEIIVHVNAGTRGRPNGSQALWIDGVKKIEVRHMRWRDTDDLRLNESAIVDYMPAPPQTQHI